MHNQEESGPVMMYYFFGLLPDLGYIANVRVGGGIESEALPLLRLRGQEFLNSKVWISGCRPMNPVRRLILGSGLE